MEHQIVIAGNYRLALNPENGNRLEEIRIPASVLVAVPAAELEKAKKAISRIIIDIRKGNVDASSIVWTQDAETHDFILRFGYVSVYENDEIMKAITLLSGY